MQKRSRDILSEANWLIHNQILFGKFEPLRETTIIYKLRYYKIDKHQIIYLDDVKYDDIFTDDEKLKKFIQDLLLRLHCERLFICCKDGYDKTGLICGLLLKALQYPIETVCSLMTKKAGERINFPDSISPTNKTFRHLIYNLDVENDIFPPLLEI